jgi:hypothetical protein
LKEVAKEYAPEGTPPSSKNGWFLKKATPKNYT